VHAIDSKVETQRFQRVIVTCRPIKLFQPRD